MNYLIYHIASGHAFFSGAVLILVGVALVERSTRYASRLGVLMVLIGSIGVAISATPLSLWLYSVASFITLSWLVCTVFDSIRKWRRILRFCVLGIWGLAMGLELPFHFIPNVSPVTSRSITVIGDSISAGLGASDPAISWPNLLAEELNLEIQDLSRVGETVASAWEGAVKQPIHSRLIILEIGGNDLLGNTTNAQFEKDLAKLLDYVCDGNRQVVMFELPLPPFRNEFGRIQRKLAAQYGVVLIPKRVLLSVLTAEDSTVDGIHLTANGHRRMADVVRGVIEQTQFNN